VVGLGGLSALIYAVGVYGPASGWLFHHYRDSLAPPWEVEQHLVLDWSNPAFLYPWLEKSP
jgi:hypothetical protein